MRGQRLQEHHHLLEVHRLPSPHPHVPTPPTARRARATHAARPSATAPAVLFQHAARPARGGVQCVILRACRHTARVILRACRHTARMPSYCAHAGECLQADPGSRAGEEAGAGGPHWPSRLVRACLRVKQTQVAGRGGTCGDVWGRVGTCGDTTDGPARKPNSVDECLDTRVARSDETTDGPEVDECLDSVSCPVQDTSASCSGPARTRRGPLVSCTGQARDSRGSGPARTRRGPCPAPYAP